MMRTIGDNLEHIVNEIIHIQRYLHEMRGIIERHQ